MKKFSFNLPRLIEVNSCAHLAELISSRFPTVSKSDAILLVTDEGIIRNNLEKPALNSLRQHGFNNINIYEKVEANPPVRNVLECTKFSKKCNVKLVIGLGGGSPLDVAKMVSYLVENDNGVPIDSLYGVGNLKGKNRLPLIQIPTTAGTGSEVTPISILTTEAQEKKGIVDPVLLPDVAYLDASLTFGLPKEITAYTGIDAMCHAIEAMTSRVKKNELSDVFAMQALGLLGSNIRAVCTESGSKDLATREAMLMGSMYAGISFANAPVGGVHVLAYSLGQQYHVPHGLSISVMLPWVLRFNGKNSPMANQAYKQCLKTIFPGKKQTSLSEEFYALAKELGLKTKLSEFGIQKSDLPRLVEEAMRQTRLLPNNPCDLTSADALKIYEEAL